MGKVRASLGATPPRVKESRGSEPIAIIGVGCRFPQADGPAQFWDLLVRGGDAISEVPADHFDVDAYYDPRPGTPGKIVTRWGGFLDGIDRFDASFFSISPREAARMDPQQRLLLEVAWEALEDAGQVAERLAGTRCGVFVGACYNDYEDLMIGDPAGMDVYSIAGGCRSVLAGRLSYALGFDGPSLQVDTACSSSLVAVHLACQSLRNGESGLALAAGVNLVLVPEFSVGFSSAGMLSPDGRCKFGDARADGFVRSDGVGVVVLKPLSGALADGDPIYAVIRGSAVNNDSRSSGYLMTPAEDGQAAVLTEAYGRAGVEPSRVDYVEAHGTGTRAGDPVELKALARVLGSGRDADRPLLVGSVKTNIGHTEGAAGIAGLIKVALSLTHKVIPGSLHFETPSPVIPWQGLPLRVQSETTSWPANGTLATAGVSSFGIGGTNAHVVVTEAPPPLHIPTEGSSRSALLLPLSASNPPALVELAQRYASFLERTDAELRDVCYAAGAKRTHHAQRLALVGRSRAELVHQLNAFCRDEAHAGVVAGRSTPDREHKVVFVFPGQGSQWLGMGRRLMSEEPIFRQQLEACEAAMRPLTDWSLLEELASDSPDSRLESDISVIQPALFAIEVALAALWRSWGVEPDAVVGHSMGEVAAAYVAGALTLEDAATVICRRSQLLRRISGQGAMAVVDLSLPEAEQAISGYEDKVSVAVSNSPGSTVLSGDTEVLTEVMGRLDGDGVFCRLVKVDVASHSPQVDCLKEELLHVLQSVQPRAARIPMVSTVRAEVMSGLELDASYWVQNLRHPVLFAAVIHQLTERGHDAFIEMSPNPLLVGAVQQTARQLGRGAVALPSFRRDEHELQALLESLAGLYTVGYPVDWEAVYVGSGTSVRLPTYPWQRESFWLPPAKTRRHSPALGSGQHRDHPFLGEHVVLASPTGGHVWEVELDLERFPYLRDHRFNGSIIFPAAGYVEMLLEIPSFASGEGRVVRNLTIHNALVLAEDEARTVQLAVKQDGPGVASFEIYSRVATAETSGDDWTLHASGDVRTDNGETAGGFLHQGSASNGNVGWADVRTKEAHYQLMEDSGLHYGPCFQRVESILRGPGKARGHVGNPSDLAGQADGYRLHPAVLDACIQVCLGEVLSAVPQPPESAGKQHLTYVPVAISRLQCCRAAEHEPLVADARLRTTPQGAEATVDVDLTVHDERGDVVLEAAGVRFQRVEASLASPYDDWLYTLTWEPEKLGHEEPSSPTTGRKWLILADSRDVAMRAIALLEERGDACVMATPGPSYRQVGPKRYHVDPTQVEDFNRLLRDAFPTEGDGCHGVLHFWSLESHEPEELGPDGIEADYPTGVISGLHLVQALTRLEASPKLCFVTRGACRVVSSDTGVAVMQAPLRGLARTISNEHPELRCTTVDLSANPGEADLRNLVQEASRDVTGGDVALRRGERWVCRLVPYTASPTSNDEELGGRRWRKARGDEPFQLRSTGPGILDNLVLYEAERRQPERGEIEIRVRAAGLNFRDVMSALGMLEGYPGGMGALGHECAGIVTATGDDVQGFHVGDEVVALGYNTFGSYVTTDARLVAHKPACLSPEEAVTLPIAFLTASYALEQVARMAAGERVLIHSATGGVGLAAVQLAQAAGVEIFATAGSPEKRDYLHSLGIRHVMDSRTLSFADEVMETTEGRGVDVVLNSLAGEFIPKSLSVLAPYGHFVEIGRRDIYQNSHLGLLPFQRNLSFSAVDLDRMFRDRPATVGKLLRDLMQRAERGAIHPLPFESFPITEAVGAFQHMARARHIGKIVVSLDVPEVDVIAPLRIRSDASYLITGGLGGLGLVTAQWLVDQGARHLVLVGRRGLTSEAQPVVETLRARGAEIVIAQTDISQEAQVADLFSGILRALPPLRGIVHAAGILDDGILAQQTQERFVRVMSPKVRGAWNLHSQTGGADLDFFVLFSSAAALVGSPGQGNYVSANAFLDSLAEYRRLRDLPALSVNWGPWSDVGLAARPDRGDRLALRGMKSIAPEQGAEILGRLLPEDAVQIAVMPMDWQQWKESYPVSSASPLLAALVGGSAVTATPDGQGPEFTLDDVLAVEPRARAGLLEAYLSDQLGRILQLPASRLDTHRPLVALGLDSLMAVELRARLERGLGVSVGVTTLLRDLSIAQLAEHVVPLLSSAGPEGTEGMAAKASARDISSVAAHGSPSAVVDEVERLSDEEVGALLEQLLSQDEARE